MFDFYIVCNFFKQWHEDIVCQIGCDLFSSDNIIALFCAAQVFAGVTFT